MKKRLVLRPPYSHDEIAVRAMEALLTGHPEEWESRPSDLAIACGRIADCMMDELYSGSDGKAPTDGGSHGQP